jgi:hypothetical protein
VWEGEYGANTVYHLYEGEYGANTVYTSIQMEKLKPVETVLGMEEGKIKENDGGGEFKYDIL